MRKTRFVEKKFNKRGEIPVTILVLGVFAICTLALISFFSASIDKRDSFFGGELMKKLNIEIEKYFSGESLDKLNVKIDSSGNKVLYQEKYGNEGFLFWKKEFLEFSVEYIIE